MNMEAVTVIQWSWHMGVPDGAGSHRSILNGKPSRDEIMKTLQGFWVLFSPCEFSFTHVCGNEPYPLEGMIDVISRWKAGLLAGRIRESTTVHYVVKTALVIDGKLYELTEMT